MKKIDGRKNNGGHSTKAKRINDGRLNSFKKTFLDDWTKDKENQQALTKVFNKLQDKAVRGDFKAITLYLAYILGKPKEIVEHTGLDASGIDIVIRKSQKEKQDLKN